jgi:NADH-quinone oxidoreductase subunit F
VERLPVRPEGREPRAQPGRREQVEDVEDERSLEVAREGVLQKKSMLGSAAIIVMNEDTCIVDAAQNLSKFFSHESCGQCTPCREGTPWLHKVVSRIEAGQGRLEDIDLLERIANQMANGMTICVFADAAIAPILSSIGKFRDEYRYHVEHKRCMVGERAAAPELVTA